ncbi:MAG TPA: CDP-alcohol phosphatidyltransferase family protein [candidate division Zixibacteria bacterium]|nr:CDP-alcohol phosphatidyltransferase family protein [candidate division Zixibacteria bacterium]
MNLPNILTIIRIIIAPLVFLAINAGGKWLFPGLGLFAAGAATDWLDGYFARRNKTVTGFGQFADPVADKLLSGFALAVIAATGYSAVWPVIGIITRDVLVTSFRLWGMSKSKKILPSRTAKAKTAGEMISIIGIMTYMALGGSTDGFWHGTVALIVVFALAWATAINYFWKNRDLIFGHNEIIDERADRQL